MGNSARWSEDVTVREIPVLRLIAAAWLVFVVVAAGMIAWELQMRSLGLHAGDLDDSPSHWAVERRKLEAGDHDGVVIFGSSRLLFDTDLDAWNQMTGRRPIQLALPGTNPRPFLVRFAEESDFAGLIVVDVTPELYFSGLVSALPEFRNVQDFWQEESPSQRFGHQVGLALSRYFAFLEDQYTLTTLIEQIDIPNRKGVRGPYMTVWKLSESTAGRQTRMWPRLETDQRLQDHAMRVWMSRDRGRLDADLLARAIDESRQAIEKIRARGGEVVFIRPPSRSAYHEREERNVPRVKSWDPLLRETGAFGINFEDYPEMQGLEIPEMSHLSRESATRFTRAYVDVILKNVPWLSSHSMNSPAAGEIHG